MTDRRLIRRKTLVVVATGVLVLTAAAAPQGSAVSIGVHTDDVGAEADNFTLSQARAQAVALASHGDASGRSKNRRVEIRFAW